MQLPSWPVAFPAMLPLCISLEAPPGQLDHLEALSLPRPLACSVSCSASYPGSGASAHQGCLQGLTHPEICKAAPCVPRGQAPRPEVRGDSALGFLSGSPAHSSGPQQPRLGPRGGERSPRILSNLVPGAGGSRGHRETTV